MIYHYKHENYGCFDPTFISKYIINWKDSHIKQHTKERISIIFTYLYKKEMLAEGLLLGSIATAVSNINIG